jgi:hypothetical protein
MEREYKRLSPTPEAFPTLVEGLRALDASPANWPEDAIRAIRGKTMVVIGDADGVRLEHAVALFKLRGGGDQKAAAQGFMTEAPRAAGDPAGHLAHRHHGGGRADRRSRHAVSQRCEARHAPGFFEAPGEKSGGEK